MGILLKKYDFEVVSGLKDGVGISNVGIEADWNMEPVGTPCLLELYNIIFRKHYSD